MNVLQFAPRRWSSLPQVPHRLDEEHNLDQLRAEHPLLSRSVEVLELSSWVASSQSQGQPWSGAATGLGVVTSLAAAAWGVNKLARGQTGLDRVEGVGHLALSAAYGAGAFNLAGIVNPASALASGCEVLLGGADLVRGIREKDHLRAWTGAAGVLSGAALATSLIAPGATGFAQAMAVVSMATRQSILGAR
ncbi:hypothetical protein JST97_19180 [bacterium]|nr:hypothetical protein [bacterium]